MGRTKRYSVKKTNAAADGSGSAAAADGAATAADGRAAVGAATAATGDGAAAVPSFQQLVPVVAEEEDVPSGVTVAPPRAFEVKDTGVFGYGDGDGEAQIDVDFVHYVIVNPGGAKASSVKGLSSELLNQLSFFGVNSQTYDKDLKKAPCFRCYVDPNNGDDSLSVIYVNSISYPKQRSTESKFEEYWKDLKNLYKTVFELCVENKQPRVRVPMIGLGVNCSTVVIAEMVVKNVQLAKEAFDEIEADLSVEFCIFKREEYQMYENAVNDEFAGGDDADFGLEEEIAAGSEEENNSDADANNQISNCEADVEQQMSVEEDFAMNAAGACSVADLSTEGRLEKKVAKRTLQEVQKPKEKGMKRFKFQGGYRAADSLLSLIEERPKYEKVVSSVCEFVQYRFNNGSLAICLKSQRILSISDESVTSFLWIMLNRDSEFIQEVVGERVLLVHDRRNNSTDDTILVSGQHRGAIILMLHLGMASVLTDQGHAYIKSAKAKSPLGDEYDYSTVTGPQFNWGYKNYELWEEFLKTQVAELADSNKKKKVFQKFLKTSEHCFMWIRKLKTLSCFHEECEEDSKRNLLDMETVQAFYSAKFHFYSVSGTSRENLFKYFVATFCIQRQQTFDTLSVMACSSLVQAIRSRIDMYDAHADKALQNLYVRPNLPDCEPGSSFYVDLVLANMLVEKQFDGLVPSSCRVFFNQETAFVALTAFSTKCEPGSEFEKRLLSRVERVKTVLKYFNATHPDFAKQQWSRNVIEHRRNELIKVMPKGGPTLRDALVLFWYMIMSTENTLEDTPSAANDFTKFALPEALHSHQINVNKSIFAVLLNLVNSSKNFESLAKSAVTEIKFEPLGLPKHQ